MHSVHLCVVPHMTVTGSDKQMTPRGACGTFPMLCRHCVGVLLTSDICRIKKKSLQATWIKSMGRDWISSFILMSGHQTSDECFTLAAGDEVLYCVYIPMNLSVIKIIWLTNIASICRIYKNCSCKEVKVKNVTYKCLWQWECLCTCMWGQGLYMCIKDERFEWVKIKFICVIY